MADEISRLSHTLRQYLEIRLGWNASEVATLVQLIASLIEAYIERTAKKEKGIG